MPAPEGLRERLHGFAAHLRDPATAPPPAGIEERRLQVYRDLFYNNLQSLLAGNFPVIRRLLGDGGWHALVRDFYREYRCRTPLFPEIPREFIQYLQSREASRGDPPWLVELAHYEWVELALDISEAREADVPHDPAGDLLAGAPAPSPLAWPLAYAWPVHRLAPGFLPDAPPPVPTFLLVQRDATGKVRFNETSALTFRLLQRLDETPAMSGREQLQALAAEAGRAGDGGFLAAGEAMLRTLHESRVLLGTRRHD